MPIASTIVVSNVSSAGWAKAKPADYKSPDLDKALKAYEGLAGKGVLFPNIPEAPKLSVEEIDDCIKSLKSAITQLEKGQAVLKQTLAALEGVRLAAGKTWVDLRKLAKEKQGKDKDAYEAAAGIATGIEMNCRMALADYK